MLQNARKSKSTTKMLNVITRIEIQIEIKNITKVVAGLAMLPIMKNSKMTSHILVSGIMLMKDSIVSMAARTTAANVIPKEDSRIKKGRKILPKIITTKGRNGVIMIVIHPQVLNELMKVSIKIEEIEMKEMREMTHQEVLIDVTHLKIIGNRHLEVILNIVLVG